MGGEPEGAPDVIMTAIGDVSTGAHAMGAICAALLYRERTGRGQYLDLSLLDTYFHYHEARVETLSLSKGESSRPVPACTPGMRYRPGYSRPRTGT